MFNSEASTLPQTLDTACELMASHSTAEELFGAEFSQGVSRRQGSGTGAFSQPDHAMGAALSTSAGLTAALQTTQGP
ncbi:hypothetical protein [Paludibacterium denitrificans]|uniref:hypothetical protein n=1 Tax=Paludibacterium denitrificans TaxID=2675226 RepID=UPI001E509AC8|nr:hypothetical protein [Paludibacterium denitrificans]